VAGFTRPGTGDFSKKSAARAARGLDRIPDALERNVTKCPEDASSSHAFRLVRIKREKTRELSSSLESRMGRPAPAIEETRATARA
jgi:hypothetical protein